MVSPGIIPCVKIRKLLVRTRLLLPALSWSLSLSHLLLTLIFMTVWCIETDPVLGHQTFSILLYAIGGTLDKNPNLSEL